MTNREFYGETKASSKAKINLICAYFTRWSRIILETAKRKSPGNMKIAYLDLYAGQGRYENGMPSTPLRILCEAIKDKELSRNLVSFFNEGNRKRFLKLKREIAGLKGLENLKYPPIVENEKIGDKLQEKLRPLLGIPTLVFADPWGYKGLSLDLFWNALRGWGCDCVFFFNYNRVNPAISNPKVLECMIALFGSERATRLNEEVSKSTPADRQQRILSELELSLREIGAKFFFSFPFRDNRKRKTSHYLIFVTKNFRGFEIAKEVCAKESTQDEQGFASMEFNPRNVNQPTLTDFSPSLEQLSGELVKAYSGKAVTVEQVYLEHSQHSRYRKPNYRAAIDHLWKKGTIRVIFVPNSSGKTIRRVDYNTEVVFP